MVYVASWLRNWADASRAIEAVDLDDDGSPERRGALDRYLPDEVRLVQPKGTDSGGFDHFVAIGAPAIRRISVGWSRSAMLAVDEGLGSYGTIRTRTAALTREGKSEMRAVSIAAVRGVSRWLLAGERWRLYQREGERWFPNRAIATEFARHCGHVVAQDHVVYLSQPWVEFGLVSEAAYLRHIAGVQSTVRATGRGLIVRPHPLESPRRYRSHDVVGSSGPAEADPLVVGAAAVVGDTSTALVNLASMFGTRAYRVSLEEPAIWPHPMSRQQRSLFDSFVDSPSTLDALGERLRP